MSHTKYVMEPQGLFAIVSKMVGVEHWYLADHIGGANGIKTAGFLYADPQGTIQSYGQSISTAKRSDPEDGPVILSAIHRGEVFIVEHPRAGYFFATNNRKVIHPDSKVATIDLLREYRIFETDD